MSVSTVELAEARAIVNVILDALGLDAYLFSVEPRGDGWAVRVECAVAVGWETIEFTESAQRLLRSVDDPEVQRQLLDSWQQALSACRLKTQEPS